MIKTEKGASRLKGPAEELLADFACIARSLREGLAEKWGEEEADRRIQGAFDRSKKSEEEIKELLKNKLGELFKELFN